MKTPVTVYNKLSSFLSSTVYVLDLQDNCNIVTGDNEGEICIWDYHKNRNIYTGKGKHNSRIISINLLKKYEKIIIASVDNVITIWKLKYNTVGGEKVIDENLYCESIFRENFGGNLV